jgi:hypothetical protein
MVSACHGTIVAILWRPEAAFKLPPAEPVQSFPLPRWEVLAASASRSNLWISRHTCGGDSAKNDYNELHARVALAS